MQVAFLVLDALLFLVVLATFCAAIRIEQRLENWREFTRLYDNIRDAERSLQRDEPKRR